MTAQQINHLGRVLEADLVAWGAAAIGMAIVAASALWVLRMLR